MAAAVVRKEASGQDRAAGLGRWWRLWLCVASLVVMGLGAVEGWCGRTDSGDVYGSDAVQYLDVARAFERGDWKSALNPLWSQGYPALLAMARPLFGAGPAGDWAATRWLNLGVFGFTWAAFVWMMLGMERALRRRLGAVVWVGAAGVFITAQVCVDQVSRVGPDQMVAGFFFLVCGLMLRLGLRPRLRLAAGLGVALGAGFLVKAVFLPLGVVALLGAGAAGWVRARREVAIAGVLFAAIVLGYGAALSRAVGRPTLGEAGSLNYAWHVNRLSKWVHWEGGVDAAEKAWPKPWIARFARWESDPPDFGMPVHPSVRVGIAPTIYVFHAPVRATYAPYYDPDYWYQGYRHVVRWRYQVVALGKSVGEFAGVLLRQPLVWAFGLVVMAGLWRREDRVWFLRLLAPLWVVLAVAVIGVGIYLPVHLEGRYLAPFLAVIAVGALVGLEPLLGGPRGRVIGSLLLLGFAAGLVKDQGGVWVRALRGWTPRANVEWRAADGVRGLGLPAGSEVGVIAWTANLHCDWAYMAGLQITSEVASAADEKAFWELPAAGQSRVLGEFRAAGARAVFSWDRPAMLPAGWVQVGGAPMWIYRF